MAATTTFVVLLRGVNVGKAKRVPMADFEKLLLDLGCQSVSTILNSGNAVVRARRQQPAALARKIADSINASMGFSVPVVVKTGEEFVDIVRGNVLVFDAADHSRLLVAFAQDRAAISPLTTLADLLVPPEQFLLRDDAAYLLCARGILESKAAEALLGKVGRMVTTRNWATVMKLHALVVQEQS